MRDPLPIDESRRCADCGASFIHSARDRVTFAHRGWQAPKRCVTCRRGAERASAPAIPAEPTAPIAATCWQCATPFEIGVGEQEFLIRTFGDQALLPRRCLPCRRAARHN